MNEQNPNRGPHLADPLADVAEQYRRLLHTPVVDDDFPEVLHDFDSTLRRATAFAQGDAKLLAFRDACVVWRATPYSTPDWFSAGDLVSERYAALDPEHRREVR